MRFNMVVDLKRYNMELGRISSRTTAPAENCRILYLFKVTAMPNLRAVTLYVVEFL